MYCGHSDPIINENQVCLQPNASSWKLGNDGYASSLQIRPYLSRTECDGTAEGMHRYMINYGARRADCERNMDAHQIFSSSDHLDPITLLVAFHLLC